MASTVPAAESNPELVPAGAAQITAEVTRGACRMLLRHECVAMAEVPLGDGRRADLMALNPRGEIIIVEVKVSRADLMGDGKWTDYLAHCDRFFWAVPAGFDLAPLESPGFLPERAGVIVADRYDAAIVREARTVPLASATRRKCTLAFARRAARRVITLTDPDAEGLAWGG